MINIIQLANHAHSQDGGYEVDKDLEICKLHAEDNRQNKEFTIHITTTCTHTKEGAPDRHIQVGIPILKIATQKGLWKKAFHKKYNRPKILTGGRTNKMRSAAWS